MFLFIWVNYLNVSLMDFVFLEPLKVLKNLDHIHYYLHHHRQQQCQYVIELD